MGTCILRPHNNALILTHFIPYFTIDHSHDQVNCEVRFHLF